jgi:hypothetical protein
MTRMKDIFMMRVQASRLATGPDHCSLNISALSWDRFVGALA